MPRVSPEWLASGCASGCLLVPVVVIALLWHALKLPSDDPPPPLHPVRGWYVVEKQFPRDFDPTPTLYLCFDRAIETIDVKPPSMMGPWWAVTYILRTPVHADTVPLVYAHELNPYQSSPDPTCIWLTDEGMHHPPGGARFGVEKKFWKLRPGRTTLHVTLYRRAPRKESLGQPDWSPVSDTTLGPF
jgi:hypothetical protein